MADMVSGQPDLLPDPTSEELIKRFRIAALDREVRLELLGTLRHARRRLIIANAYWWIVCASAMVSSVSSLRHAINHQWERAVCLLLFAASTVFMMRASRRTTHEQVSRDVANVDSVVAKLLVPIESISRVAAHGDFSNSIRRGGARSR
ncbi:hypothetical protein LZC95_19985 [Pendulispora brunnea]|uniref:SMODS and SLOG-associating 2TM effector domain-containing protein n=1 Tax=Pendulispora brunnea TaxID=2905690 RepID=A0ABZ2KKA2_9BACT